MLKRNLLIILIVAIAAVVRLWGLDHFPAGLNADEAAIGYNDYSLLKTGLDEHGTAWPLSFRSFDDYKPGIYFYLALPFVAIMGLNVWAVRLPSAILGVATVYLVYLLANVLFQKKNNQKITVGHLAALLLATSPWHIHFSRGGWEANAATFFLTLGLYYLVKSLENSRYFWITTIALVISLYTYHSLRVVTPLLFLSFILLNFSQVKLVLGDHSKRTPILIAVFIGLVLLVPLGLQVVTGAVASRFSGVSVFADQGPYWEALELRRGHPTGSFVARLLHSQYGTYTYRITQNYLSHFSPRFLFIIGDEIARSKVPGMGQLLLTTLPFLVIGLFFTVGQAKENASHRLILSWFLLAPVAAALTFQSPHALRAQNMTIPLAIITAIGLYESFSFLKTHKLKYLLASCGLLTSLFITYDFSRYLHQYFIHYPKELPYAWQYGFDQIAAHISANEDKYDHIIITDRYDQPYILMAFFMKLPPTLLQQAVLTPRDRFGFSTVRNLGKLEFRQINYGEDKKLRKTLLVIADEPVDDTKVIHTISDPAGNIMYKFISLP